MTGAAGAGMVTGAVIGIGGGAAGIASTDRKPSATAGAADIGAVNDAG